MYAALKNRFYAWIFQWRGPETGAIVLVQRRVFILPTRQGLVFAVVLLVMLAGSINYSLGLGFVLTFTLASMAGVAMLHTWRNLALDVGHVLTYFVAHEGHHRGQLTLLARQFGVPLPQAVRSGLWQWQPLKR